MSDMEEIIGSLICGFFVLGIPIAAWLCGEDWAKREYYDKGREEGISMSPKQAEDYLRNRYKKELGVLESAGFVLRKRGE